MQTLSESFPVQHKKPVYTPLSTKINFKLCTFFFGQNTALVGEVLCTGNRQITARVEVLFGNHMSVLALNLQPQNNMLCKKYVTSCCYPTFSYRQNWSKSSRFLLRYNLCNVNLFLYM